MRCTLGSGALAPALHKSGVKHDKTQSASSQRGLWQNSPERATTPEGNCLISFNGARRTVSDPSHRSRCVRSKTQCRAQCGGKTGSDGGARTGAFYSPPNQPPGAEERDHKRRGLFPLEGTWGKATYLGRVRAHSLANRHDISQKTTSNGP